MCRALGKVISSSLAQSYLDYDASIREIVMDFSSVALYTKQLDEYRGETGEKVSPALVRKVGDKMLHEIIYFLLKTEGNCTGIVIES